MGTYPTQKRVRSSESIIQATIHYVNLLFIRVYYIEKVVSINTHDLFALDKISYKHEMLTL